MVWLYLVLWFWLPPALATATDPRTPPRFTPSRAALLALALFSPMVIAAAAVVNQWDALTTVLLLSLLIAALAFFSNLRPNGNLFSPLLALALLSLLWLAQGEQLSPGLRDILERSAPAVLILVGLRALTRLALRGYRQKMRSAFLSNALAFVGAGALLLLINAQGIALQEVRPRSETRVGPALEHELAPNLKLLRLQLNLVASDLILERTLAPFPQMQGNYEGSANHTLTILCNGDPCAVAGQLPIHEDGTADFRVDEMALANFPPLNQRGRGELRLQIPPGIPLDLLVNSRQGIVTLSLQGLELERLNLNLRRGDALISLPDYAPLGTPRGGVTGRLSLLAGSLKMRLPAEMTAQFTLLDDTAAEYPAPHFTRVGDTLVANAAAVTGAWNHLELAVHPGPLQLLLVEN